MRFACCLACALAGCFSDQPTPGGSGDSEDSTASSASTSTSTSTSTSMSTSTSASSSASGTTTEPETSSESGAITSDVTTSVETSSDPSSSGDTGRCVSTDFEGIPITCVNGDLAVALGFGQVTFNSGNAATMMSPCIEDASDLNGWTSPLSGRYVFVEIQPDNPATLTFDMPVASVSFDVGPHYQQDSTGNIALCGTTAGTCENADVVADQSTPGTMMMDMAGETTLFVFMNKGIGNIGIDNLQVCFD